MSRFGVITHVHRPAANPGRQATRPAENWQRTHGQIRGAGHARRSVGATRHRADVSVTLASPVPASQRCREWRVKSKMVSALKPALAMMQAGLFGTGLFHPLLIPDANDHR